MIRFAGQADIQEIKDLWTVCFPDEDGFFSYFFGKIFRPDYTLILEEGNKLCAMLQMLPYRLKIGEREESITYIYGACTSPEFRRKGYMANLLERSFEIDKIKGYAASVLIPQEKWLFEFYRQFGYEPFFSVSRGVSSRSEGEMLMPVRLSIKDIPHMQMLYNECVPKCHVPRSMDEWHKQISMFDALGKGVYGWFNGNRLSAYAFCWANNAQEALGMTEPHFNGLLNLFGADTFSYTSCGVEDNLGCIKWYKTKESVSGYMNLMLN